MRTIVFQPEFADWRHVARAALTAGLHPDSLQWQAQRAGEARQGDLFFQSSANSSLDAPPSSPSPLRCVSRQFLELAERVSYHRHPSTWDLLYRLLWRMVHDQPRLLDDRADDEVNEFFRREHAVRRDAHKMKAFVRFQRVLLDDGAEHFIAWHEPDHPLLAYVVPFFQDRFAVMSWTILTPDASASWDGKALRYGPGCPQAAAPRGDELEDLWRCYYASIFNPARVKTRAMKAEMPVRYWKSLPETRIIGELLENAASRVEAMILAAPPSAESYLPDARDLTSLKNAVQQCRACDFCERTTQAVFSEGPVTARIMLVGEQPGDQEDLEGRPFVGPAGQILERALLEAGLCREDLYITNAVKHFKHHREGKRRIHDRPTPRDVAACKPWLGAELRLVKPPVLVCLGWTSALAVFGRTMKMNEVRGRVFKTGAAPTTIVTWHPSHILRIPEPDQQELAFSQLVEDLRLALQCADHNPQSH